MGQGDKDARAARIRGRLISFSAFALPGLQPPNSSETLSLQFVDSLRRVEFAHYLRDGRHSADRSNPSRDIFDPFRAAVLANRVGDIDQASWLVFLGTHFGKHEIDGWRLARDVYGRLHEGQPWSWITIRDHFDAFEQWLPTAVASMRSDGVSRRFSNHRKYESLDQLREVFRSYVDWVGGAGGHPEMIRSIHQRMGQDPTITFAALYDGMSVVRRFGRLGKFDYLAMLGKLGIAPIEPGTPYLDGATGPLRGARLLLTGDPTAPMSKVAAERRVVELGLELGLGMQVMEDALCNWQKSPQIYRHFRG